MVVVEYIIIIVSRTAIIGDLSVKIAKSCVDVLNYGLKDVGIIICMMVLRDDSGIEGYGRRRSELCNAALNMNQDTTSIE